jgi:hypothetical protein
LIVNNSKINNKFDKGDKSNDLIEFEGEFNSENDQFKPRLISKPGRNHAGRNTDVYAGPLVSLKSRHASVNVINDRIN